MNLFKTQTLLSHEKLFFFFHVASSVSQSYFEILFCFCIGLSRAAQIHITSFCDTILLGKKIRNPNGDSQVELSNATIKNTAHYCSLVHPGHFSNAIIQTHCQCPLLDKEISKGNPSVWEPTQYKKFYFCSIYLINVRIDESCIHSFTFEII